MRPAQLQWLEAACAAIPDLFARISAGADQADHVLGERMIGRRRVRLVFRVQVVDPGANPLATHGGGATANATERV